jgi:hypothetical protein
MKYDSFLVPETVADIQTMIRDKVQENIHLDYKDSRAIRNDARDDIAKDVSAFANSDGGVLIYGVKEKDHLPVEVDSGVDDAQISREWIESAVMTGITPRLDDVRITALPVSPGRSAYIIEAAKTFRGPHQASDKRYYRRHNFKSVPKEDYEIADVRNRRSELPALVSFNADLYGGTIIVFDVENIGAVTAEELNFEFSEPLHWPDRTPMPRPLADGIRRLAPRQKLRFRYFQTFEIFSGESQGPLLFSVRVTYTHAGLNRRVSEDWLINFEMYHDALVVRSNEEAQANKAIKALEAIADNVEKLRRTIAPLANVAEDGIDMSSSTLRHLRLLLKSTAHRSVGSHRGRDHEGGV